MVGPPKRGSLAERPGRMPDVGEPAIVAAIERYLEEIGALNTETARSMRFQNLMGELFGEAEPRFAEEYLQGLERYVRIKGKDLVYRGRVDALYGNLIIEFERNLQATGAEAREQLRGYAAALWSDPEGRQFPYLCMATDGVRFELYVPNAPDGPTNTPEEVELVPLGGRVDLTRLKPMDAFYWLDRYFFRKKVRAPSSEEFEADFGLHSTAFRFTLQDLGALWGDVGAQSDFDVVYRTWSSYLAIAYGSADAAQAELFLRHTYLATLAKLMAWLRLRTEEPVADSEVAQVLAGSYFEGAGLSNFLEEDFFSWLTRGVAQQRALAITKRLVRQLEGYNLREISEDVLKALYQELVDPATRHDLGEYYTPDWLAERMLRRELDRSPSLRVLDPACGSGTFLYTAVRLKRETLGDSASTLQHITESVVGLDIHPLAVTVAKTNFVLGLGDLLRRRRGGTVHIPVYLSNAIQLPEFELSPRMPLTGEAGFAGRAYRVKLGSKQVSDALIPEALADQPLLYDAAIDTASDFAQTWAGRTAASREAFDNLLQRRAPAPLSQPEQADALYQVALRLKHLIEQHDDSIWGFVLKNSYKVVGNPPWLTYNRVRRGEYQEFLKRTITRDHELLLGRAELITHMELAGLFFVRSAGLYLKPGGRIAFVMPRGVLTADQHDALRSMTYVGPVALDAIWDLAGVTPLFRIAACVLFGRRVTDLEEKHARRDLAGEILAGRLPRKNASLPEADDALSLELTPFRLHRVGERSYLAPATGESGAPTASAHSRSPYAPSFSEGATLFPRPFWFVEPVPQPLGFDPARPSLRSTPESVRLAKPPWGAYTLAGAVESEFLYATLLSTEVVPFGHLGLRLVVLLMRPTNNGFRMLRREEAERGGYLGLAEWLAKAEEYWAEGRGEKAQRMDIYGRIDYQGDLTAQAPAATKVVYMDPGTNLTALVVEVAAEDSTEVEGLRTQGFVVESVTYSADMVNPTEAHYLAALLNSRHVNELVKPMQAQGLWGPRHFHKKVWELPIPRFVPGLQEHTDLATLGQECARKVGNILPSAPTQPIGRLRGWVRSQLRGELEQIDCLTRLIVPS